MERGGTLKCHWLTAMESPRTCRPGRPLPFFILDKHFWTETIIKLDNNARWGEKGMEHETLVSSNP